MVLRFYVSRAGQWIMEDDLPSTGRGIGKFGIHRLTFPDDWTRTHYF
jgi:hypothetical protein